MKFAIRWNEDADATILGRITARDASGVATSVPGEGKWLQIADISTITCKVFDRSSETPDTAVSTPAVVVATSVLDVIATANEIWTEDNIGYNFIHDLAAASFPVGGRVYRVEYEITLVGGAVFHGVYEGRAEPIAGS